MIWKGSHTIQHTLHQQLACLRIQTTHNKNIIEDQQEEIFLKGNQNIYQRINKFGNAYYSVPYLMYYMYTTDAVLRGQFPFFSTPAAMVATVAVVLWGIAAGTTLKDFNINSVFT